MTERKTEKTNPEIEKWLSVYGQDVFPTPYVGFGGAIRRTMALRECLKVCFYLQAGTMDDLILHLKKRLGLTGRKLREEYVEDLLFLGIIKQNSSEWKYMGKMPE